MSKSGSLVMKVGTETFLDFLLWSFMSRKFSRYFPYLRERTTEPRLEQKLLKPAGSFVESQVCVETLILSIEAMADVATSKSC